MVILCYIWNDCRLGPMIGLLLISIGTGGIKPCVSAFGGDQFSSNQVQARTPPFITILSSFLRLLLVHSKHQCKIVICICMFMKLFGITVSEETASTVLFRLLFRNQLGQLVLNDYNAGHQRFVWQPSNITLSTLCHLLLCSSVNRVVTFIAIPFNLLTRFAPTGARIVQAAIVLD